MGSLRPVVLQLCSNTAARVDPQSCDAIAAITSSQPSGFGPRSGSRTSSNSALASLHSRSSTVRRLGGAHSNATTFSPRCREAARIARRAASSAEPARSCCRTALRARPSPRNAPSLRMLYAKCRGSAASKSRGCSSANARHEAARSKGGSTAPAPTARSHAAGREARA
eukprot:3361227-Prymnesium_polylepis.1